MPASLKTGLGVVALALLVGGCQSWLPWNNQGNGGSPGQGNCRLSPEQLNTQTKGLALQQKALASIKAEAFIPPTKPTAIDPALAERYTQEDRDLDEQRYQTALLDWQQLNAERYRLWLADHTRRERQLELGLQAKAQKLRQQGCPPVPPASP
ncbi:hypothetical protein [Cyanobium sp. WAJ14-Wanaka]|uniref:hypothetical protein n=1 Tax=Cyanobium sp. WAJ14-Wanaka TaxID=2823725 RepID=UPI0020CBE4D2|nr:hypothetical protein [Cyanobium sp. WAJ14-Wanaka]MCP9774372.1 hypothetical protein [Cyanobium sp. WAJ14-Wanaka]